MSGGKISNVTYCDYAKVKLTNGPFAQGIYWYISIVGAKQGDKVKVPFGDQIYEGEILRIDKNISSQMSPVPAKRAKKILEIIK